MSKPTLESLKNSIKTPTTDRLKKIFQGFGLGLESKELTDITGIHPWFSHKLKSTFDKYQSGGFKDFEEGKTVFKMVDTCAGEFEAYTPFFYSTALGQENESVDQLYTQKTSNYDYLIDQAIRDGRDLVLDAVIINEYNKVFVQKRRHDRKFLPNCWGIVGGHFNRSEKKRNSDTVVDSLNDIIFEDTGWNLERILSVLEIRDWEYKGIRKRTVVFDVQAKGDLDVPRLDLTKVKGFLWIDKNDLEIFDINKSYEENLMFKVCDKAIGMHNQPKKVIILGSGPIRIGQGVEFDYLTVHAVRALQKKGIKAIIINNNPETVSTDYSISDRLYFEPLTVEFVSRIVENEKEGLLGVIAQFGGQTAINLAKPLEALGIKILGTTAEAIDMAEDREQCGQIMNELGFQMPKWDITRLKSEILPKAKKLGYPVLIRPSFVLGGDGMKIVYSDQEVKTYLDTNFEGTQSDFAFDNPILIDKFLDNATEIDIDFITDGEKTYCFILEQLDKAGIHSGDSRSVFPAQSLSQEIQDKLVALTQGVAKSFGVIGVGNLQVAIQNDKIFIIEVNPRASRTVPFVSKCLGFSLTELATRVIMGEKLPEFDFDLEYYKNPEYAWSLRQEVIYKEQPVQYIAPKFVAIKWPVFCLHKLNGVSEDLGPLMKSTGEAMTVGKTFEEALAKWGKDSDLRDSEVYSL
jgi:carbamoylphosphate synthase large subunit